MKKFFGRSLSSILLLTVLFLGIGVFPEVVNNEIVTQAAFISATGWMDECKPYQYNDVTEYMGTSGNTFTVAGNEYSEGLVFYTWYSTGQAQVLYNTDGKYDSFSFSIGKIDGTTSADAVIDVYIDGILTDKLSVSANSAGKKFELKLNGAKQLRLVFYHIGHFYNVYYGLYNGKWISNGTLGSSVDDSHWLYKCPPYEINNVDLARKENNQSFTMGGKSYFESAKFYLWNGTYSSSSAKFNLNGRYDKFNFTLGHVDGTTRAPFTLKIIIDGELSETITVNADDLPKKFSVPLNKAEQIILEAYSPAASNVYDIHYAIAEANFTKDNPVNIANCNISFDSDKLLYTGKAIEPNVTITDNYYTLLKNVDYTIIYKNNIEAGAASAVITGMGDYDGKITKNFDIYVDFPLKIHLSSSEIDAEENESYDLYAVFSPENTKYISNANITWKSSNPNVAEYDINMKKILAHKAGNAVITATTVNGKSATCKIDVKPKADLNNISTISSTSIQLGETITANAKATGGTGSYQYNILYKQKAQSKWTTVQSYKTNAVVTFKPASATTYDVCIKVKDSNSTEVKKYFTVNVMNNELKNISTISAETIELGSTVTVNAKATGSTGFYAYAVYYKKASDSKWTTKQDFKSNNTIAVKPAKATIYDICVKVKDDQGTIVKKYFTVNVTAFANTSTISATEIKLGNTVKVSCSAKGSTGFYQYAVYYKKTSDTNWTTKQSYSSNNIVTIKPIKATTYQVCVKIKDNQNNEVKKYFSLTVK